MKFKKRALLLAILLLFTTILPIQAVETTTNRSMMVEISIQKRVIGKGDPLPNTALATPIDSTVLNVLETVAIEYNIPIVLKDSEYGTYLSKVGEDAEADYAPYSGYAYTVNGVVPDVGIDSYVLKPKDKIIISYCVEWKTDADGRFVPDFTLPLINTLSAKINQLSQLKKGDYTGESFSTLRDVISKAQPYTINKDYTGTDLSDEKALELNTIIGNLYYAEKSLVLVNPSKDIILSQDEAEQILAAYTDADQVESIIPMAKAIKLGYVSGYHNRLRPQTTISRAEFSKLICILLNLETTGSHSNVFADVQPKDWFYSYVSTCHKLGIVTGYNGKFNPQANITRAEMAVILDRILALERRSGVTAYIDQATIPSWALPAAKLVGNHGILIVDDNQFEPYRQVTRQEAINAIIHSIQQPKKKLGNN